MEYLELVLQCLIFLLTLWSLPCWECARTQSVRSRAEGEPTVDTVPEVRFLKRST